jgi:hypothetical protein
MKNMEVSTVMSCDALRITPVLPMYVQVNQWTRKHSLQQTPCKSTLTKPKNTSVLNTIKLTVDKKTAPKINLQYRHNITLDLQYVKRNSKHVQIIRIKHEFLLYLIIKTKLISSSQEVTIFSCQM